MLLRASMLLACLLLASAAAAETIYKYRRADGQVIYSNRRLPGVELVEAFEYRIPPPAARSAPSASEKKAAAANDERITKHLSALDAAWREVQLATRALEAAEQRQAAGVEPQPGDRQGVAVAAAPPTAGGVPATAPPALGGSMSGRRSRASPEYLSRIEALEADVQSARARLDAALRRYNELR
jgi:hypothetical protein